MSDQPFPENLISGYLDNQLSALERAEVERLMEAHPELRELKDNLAAQTVAVAGLPQFRLGDDFASRLLVDERIENAFEQIHGAKLSAQSESQYPSSNRFGLAFSAIASLAALVLITLTIQSRGPQRETVSLEPSNERVDNEQPVGSFSIETTRSKAIDEGAAADKSTLETGQLDDQQVPGDKLLALVPDDEEKRGLNAKMEQAIRAQSATQRGRPKPFVAESSPRFSKESSKTGVQFESGEHKSNAKNAGAIGSQQLGQMVEVDGSREAGRLNVVENAANEAFAPLAKGQKDVNVEFRQKSIQPAMRTAASAVDQVVKIDYQAGIEEMVDQLQLALRRHEIVLEVINDNTNSGAGRGGGGAGFGDRSGDSEDRFFAEYKKRTDTDSLALMITTTPSQMNNLVADLTKLANVETFDFAAVKNERWRNLTDALQERVRQDIQNESLERDMRGVTIQEDLADTRSAPQVAAARKRALSYRGLASPIEKNQLPRTESLELPSAASAADTGVVDLDVVNPAQKQSSLYFSDGKEALGTTQNYFLIVRGKKAEDSGDNNQRKAVVAPAASEQETPSENDN